MVASPWKDIVENQVLSVVYASTMSSLFRLKMMHNFHLDQNRIRVFAKAVHSLQDAGFANPLLQKQKSNFCGVRQVHYPSERHNLLSARMFIKDFSHLLSCAAQQQL